MAWAHSVNFARASSTGNPITQSVTIGVDDKVLVVLLKTASATNRAGGALTWGAVTLTQANSTQKAVTSPEASAEIWYLLDPTPGTQTLTIPNTNAATIFRTVVVGQQAGLSGTTTFVGANGGNATSTNPTPGAVSLPGGGVECLGYAITAGGWTTWAPGSQVGTAIANTDDGAHGGGEQYIITIASGNHTLSWTFGTSDDWGAVSAYFSFTPTAVVYYNQFNNYMGVDVGDGMSTSEKIR